MLLACSGRAPLVGCPDAKLKDFMYVVYDAPLVMLSVWIDGTNARLGTEHRRVTHSVSAAAGWSSSWRRVEAQWHGFHSAEYGRTRSPGCIVRSTRGPRG